MRAVDIIEQAVRRTVWHSLPEFVKKPLRDIIFSIRGGPGPFSIVPPPSQEVSEADLLLQRYSQVVAGPTAPIGDGGPCSGHRLTTPAAIDALVGYAHHAAVKGNDALVRYITSFYYEFPKPPSDPYSAEFRDFWMSQYKALTKRNYDAQNELHGFDEEKLRYNVYPYNTQDPKTVAKHLIAAAAILEAIDVPPPAKVLEMGVGWGNTALMLGQTGYNVTVLDIEKKYLDIVRGRFERDKLSISCLHKEFFDVEDVDETFDVILFYECFHHCLDHGRLLQILRKKLSPSGVIIFAGEPINDELPFPWGLNPSGQGVWSIALHGWMELSFTEAYFFELLYRNGFVMQRTSWQHSAHSVVYVARKI